MQISIHAPVKGATLLYVFFVLVILNFNPRTREGCDTQQVAIAKAIAGISIHAPVKGATASLHDLALKKSIITLFLTNNPPLRLICALLYA